MKSVGWGRQFPPIDCAAQAAPSRRDYRQDRLDVSRAPATPLLYTPAAAAGSGGPDSLPLAACLHCLGSIARSEGRLPEAKELFQRALAVREKLAPGSLELAVSLNVVGAF